MIETENFLVVDDCYNANPASMRASLDVLALATGRRVAVMGDMKELGENEEQLHFETGEYAARKGIDTIVCIGPLACQMYLGAKNLASGQYSSSLYRQEGIFTRSSVPCLRPGILFL